MRVFLLLTASLSHPQRSNLHYYASFPSLILPNFGFEVNGTFEITLRSDHLANYVLIMEHPSDPETVSRLRPKLLRRFCSRGLTPGSPSMRFVGFAEGGSANISGIISFRAVYTPFLVNCDYDEARYAANLSYSNPDSLIDTRLAMAGTIYRFLSYVYLLFCVLWLINAFRFSNFRVPLHTVFAILPVIRFLSTHYIALMWDDRRTNPTQSKYEITAFVLDFVYFSIYLSSIAFVGAGWCIFRRRINFSQIVRTIGVSIVSPLGVVLCPFAVDLYETLPLFGLILFGLLLYVKVNIFNIILVVKLLDSMTKQPLVSTKIKLAKRFVIVSFTHLLVTAAGSVLLLVYDMSSIAPTIFFEGLFLLGTLVQMIFFMFRKQYAGEAPGKDVDVAGADGKSRPMRLMEPHRDYLVMSANELFPVLSN
jgi:hypothetical protein